MVYFLHLFGFLPEFLLLTQLYYSMIKECQQLQSLREMYRPLLSKMVYKPLYMKTTVVHQPFIFNIEIKFMNIKNSKAAIERDSIV